MENILFVMKDSKPLKDNYEAVIVGAGCHGLSLAYNLAKGCLDDILIIDKKYVGSGATGRNAEGIQIHFESPQLSKLSDKRFLNSFLTDSRLNISKSSE